MSKLIIAIPSKGRLQENTNAFFARSGMQIGKSGGVRGYQGKLAGVSGVEVAFLSATEIVRELIAGSVHLGVTGMDLVREELLRINGDLVFVAPLGFGYADVTVAVPRSWIDVSCMADLEDVSVSFHSRHGRRMRVATKYIHLTREFFAMHGLTGYRLVESLGATEAAPGAGVAELIVDITTTGATLAANALKMLDDGIILRSEAHLIAAPGADWNDHTRFALAEILGRISAEAAACALREVRFNPAGNEELVRQAIERFDCVLPFGMEKNLVTLHCPEQNVYALAAILSAEGVDTVTVTRLDSIFMRRNSLFSEIMQRMGWDSC